jgi:cell pole-organizing protein PopZ
LRIISLASIHGEAADNKMKESLPTVPPDRAKEANTPLFRDLLSGERQEPVFVTVDSNLRHADQAASVTLARANIPMAPRAALAHSRRNVADLIAERLKLKLKQWVDQNLARVVEQIIRGEIERIAQRK